MSVQHTEAIIPEILEQNTLVTRPAIAPATPWEDAQVLATISEEHPKPDSSVDHGTITTEQIPETETPSSSESTFDSPSDNSKQDKIEVGYCIARFWCEC